MVITDRGYIIRATDGMVVGTWITSGGTFVAFPGDSAELQTIIEDLKRDGIPIIDEQEVKPGEFQFSVRNIRLPSAGLIDISNTLANLGYSLMSADEVEDGQQVVEDIITNALPVSDPLDAWYERRGYIANPDGQVITVWYIIGGAVEIQPAGDQQLESLVQRLKVDGIKTPTRTYFSRELTGRSLEIINWVDATPMEIAVELSRYGYTMLPASEVEAKSKAENWNTGGRE